MANIQDIAKRLDNNTKALEDIIHKPAGTYVNLPNGGSIPSVETWKQEVVNTALNTNNYPTRQEFDGLVDNRLVNGGMYKDFYVDQTNGNDSNNGTQESPFKSLQSAIDNIPVGGAGTIHILGDYVLTSNINIVSKIRIYLILHGTLTTTEYSPRTNYTGIYCINVTNSSLYVYITSSDNGKIVVPAKSSTNIVAQPHYAIFNGSTYSNFADIKLFLPIEQDNYNPIIVNSGFGLVSIDGWSHHRTYLNVEIAGHSSGTNRNIIVDSNSTLVSFNNATGNFYYNYSGGLTDETNTSIPVSNCVTGIVKDANGVPRNITSNIVF